MRPIGKQLTGAALALGVASSLLLGVTTLLAQSRAGCPPATTVAHCNTQEQCQAVCDSLYGEGTRIGECLSGVCCVCPH